MKRLIFDLTLEELTQQLTTWGEPSYRAIQVWQGLYHSLWNAPHQFTGLSTTLRQRLAEEFSFSHLTPQQTLRSQDGETVKILFALPDQRAIETVLMHYDVRQTLCISTQAGCAMGCVFCATGQMGFQRHLSSGEIVEQVLHLARLLRSEQTALTNIVIMGMGEPFHNYQSTLDAVDRLNHPKGLNLGARRFTISTVGLVPLIRQFGAEQRQINLAISLHAANDKLRSSLLPINRKYPLPDLIQACRDYIAQTNRRITFEWALIQDVNDSPQHAIELASLVKGLLCHINLIPLNPTHQYPASGSTRQRAAAFAAVLEQANIPCTIRIRRGVDIQAGCGQLASRNQT